MVSCIDLTIFIPTYNREQALSECLSKIYSQKFNLNKVELLVVDNKSTDNTRILLNDFKKKFKNFRFIINEKNEGYTYSQMLGYSEAKGRYVALLSSDDFYLNESINNILNVIIKHSPSAIAMNYYSIKNNRVFKGPYAKQEDKVFNKAIDIWLHPSVGHWSGLIIKKEYFKLFKKNYFDEKNLKYYEKQRGIIGFLFVTSLSKEESVPSYFIGKPQFEASRPNEIDYGILEHIYLNELLVYNKYYDEKIISKDFYLKKTRPIQKVLWKAVILELLRYNNYDFVKSQLLNYSMVINNFYLYRIIIFPFFLFHTLKKYIEKINYSNSNL